MKKIYVLISMLLFMCISACANNKIAVDQTSIYLNKDGSVQHIILEIFDKEYYNIEQLEQSIHDEVEQYNVDQAENSIVLDNISQEGEQVIVEMSFKDSSCFEQLNNAILFYGFIEEASALDQFNLPDKVISKETGEEVSIDEIENLEKKKIVITDQKVQLISEEKISYYAGDCVSVDENTIDSTDNNDLTYLILN